MKFVRSIGITMFFAFTLLQGLLFTAVVHDGEAEDILNLRLQETHMRTTSGALQAASCAGPSCLASLPVFDPPELIVPCEGGDDGNGQQGQRKLDQRDGKPTCMYKLTFCG